MSWLASIALSLLHALYRLVLVYNSFFFSEKEPRPIQAERSKLPSHLALSLVPNPEADHEANEQYMLSSVEKVAAWCRTAGIHRLTVYDREGILARSYLELRERLAPPPQKGDEESPVECDIQYPLTPPPSDDAESRPLSPRSGSVAPRLSVTTLRFPLNLSKAKRRGSVSRSVMKRRRISHNDDKSGEAPLTLHIISYQSGKPAIASTASVLLREVRQNIGHRASPGDISLPSLQELDAILEGDSGFPSPELMIVHRKPPVTQLRPPVELDGFPPWQSRLTEIYLSAYPSAWRKPTRESSQSIDEMEFRRALDEFADAEMRLGK